MKDKGKLSKSKTELSKEAPKKRSKRTLEKEAVFTLVREESDLKRGLGGILLDTEGRFLCYTLEQSGKATKDVNLVSQKESTGLNSVIGVDIFKDI